MSLRTQMRYLNPYELHKLLVNEYVLKQPGDTKLLKRDNSKDRTDYHVIRENHKFLWSSSEVPETWEEQFAKKYYEKLFKEYCISDLSRYKENKVALRWRIDKEVVVGKGQFICGNKVCNEKEELRTWEVNFAYQENNEKKNALVKIRLCPSCSKKLNYHSQKREVKRLQKKSKLKEKRLSQNKASSSTSTENKDAGQNSISVLPSTSSLKTDKKDEVESPWESHKPIETKSRDEEMEEYLQDLLL